MYSLFTFQVVLLKFSINSIQINGMDVRVRPVMSERSPGHSITSTGGKQGSTGYRITDRSPGCYFKFQTLVCSSLVRFWETWLKHNSGSEGIYSELGWQRSLKIEFRSWLCDQFCCDPEWSSDEWARIIYNVLTIMGVRRGIWGMFPIKPFPACCLLPLLPDKFQSFVTNTMI